VSSSAAAAALFLSSRIFCDLGSWSLIDALKKGAQRGLYPELEEKNVCTSCVLFHSLWALKEGARPRQPRPLSRWRGEDSHKK